jgi:hypothetical protein
MIPPMQSSELTHERIALNQSTFRDANERIDLTAESMGLDGVVPFICECADVSCTEIVPLRLDVYKAMRRHARRFFNTPGHEQLSVQAGAAVVVEKTPDYVVLDKVGEAGRIAEETANAAAPDE